MCFEKPFVCTVQKKSFLLHTLSLFPQSENCKRSLAFILPLKKERSLRFKTSKLTHALSPSLARRRRNKSAEPPPR